MADAPLIDLGAPDLFGNDAAEDEDEQVFRAYALEREEVETFADAARRLCVARAYKGEGKSALLRIAASRIVGTVLIRDSANTFAPALSGTEFPRWVREWKKAILGRVAVEVGSRIGMAWSDDAMALVEEAERQGFKSRSVLSSIIERIGLKAKVTVGQAQVEAALAKLGSPDPGAAVQRWLTGKEPVWIFVDDVDQNFQTTPENKVKVASFFIACREMTNVVPQLRIRAAVRPNVWTIMKMEFEALSHVEQYVTDLSWEEEGNRRLLARRIEGYFSRRGKWDDLVAELPTGQSERDKAVIAWAFQSPMPWGPKQVPPHVILHTMSKKRPRWLVELCKVASKRAATRKARQVERVDIYQEMSAFGKRRIQDTVAEFRSACPEIDELLAAFTRGAEEYSTAELIDVIDRKILDHLKPRIAGVLGTATARDVAAFLFEVGFFYGRRDFSDGSYEHITFTDRPTLLRARTAVDDGVRWEIHPVFRTALEMRDPSGYETAPQKEQLRAGVIRHPRKPR